MTVHLDLSGLLNRAADIVEAQGWDPRYEWKKRDEPKPSPSIQEAVERACNSRGTVFDMCLQRVRLAIQADGRKSLADFEDARNRTAVEVVALLRLAAANSMEA